ncbi:MAG TPA: BON domain-containing protein [Burkholderiales bacterium]|jgi:hypothetical protein|nr:BON domain-containing protein [Burkholderiales bacterium]
MKRVLAALVVLGLAACGEEAAKPVAVQPSPPPAEAAQSAPPLEPKMAEAPRPDPNQELARRVKRALEGESKVQAAAIDVTAADGVVTLWGTAATDAESKRAAGVAAKVEGVKSVANKLAIVKGS